MIYSKLKPRRRCRVQCSESHSSNITLSLTRRNEQLLKTRLYIWNIVSSLKHMMLVLNFEIQNINKDVPQGSVLGPLLFLYMLLV